jgi:hypothetical protein
VWKSTDGGTNWSSVLPHTNITALAIDPQSPGIIYAASTDDVLTQGKVFKSIDGGRNWTSFNEGLSNLPIESLALTSAGPNTLYASTDRWGSGGIFKITDNIPVLSVDSQYCATSRWRLDVSNATPNAPVRLSGNSNGLPWEIGEWRKTDADGSIREEGTFGVETIGSHHLRVDADGTQSNVVSFTVSACQP